MSGERAEAGCTTLCCRDERPRLGFLSSLLSDERVKLQRLTDSISSRREPPSIRSNSSSTIDEANMTDTSEGTLRCSSCQKVVHVSLLLGCFIIRGRSMQFLLAIVGGR